MRSIQRTFTRILNDILNGRHLETYVVALVGVALILVDIVGEVDNALRLSVITAALVVLLFRATLPSGEAVDLDRVLHDRNQFAPFRDFIAGARTLWVYGPSAVNIAGESPYIKREILDKGGSARFLIQDPRERHSVEILHDQLDLANDLEADIERSRAIFRKMQAWGKLEYRLLPYSPGFSLVIINPDDRDGRLIVELFGYKNELITDRMHITIRRADSPRWFDHWTAQFRTMWEQSRPDDGDSGK